MSTTWNLWHGCTKVSAGCRNCYVYRRDAEFGKDSSIVTKTKAFDLPIRKCLGNDANPRRPGLLLCYKTAGAVSCESSGRLG